MPLRRVTFSGRLGAFNEGEDKRKIFVKGVVFMCLDISITLAISIATFYLFVKKAVAPYENDFPCSDESIQKTFKPNTIGLKHLLFVSLGSPFFLISAVEGLLFFKAQGTNRLAKYFTSTTLTYLKYLLAYALCTFTMEFLKCWFGRLRPHFVAVCQPDWTKMDCSTDPSAIIPASDIVCLNSDFHRVRTARTSFPSGHTAAAVFVWLFYTFYLIRMSRISNVELVTKMRNIILPAITAWTLLTGITRVTDNWHHPTDVLGGIILALVCFVPLYWKTWVNASSVYQRREIFEAKKSE
ncbi:unnamed protein product [Auanema sp. JU1783]|nr:unnamed protein product [Auanema sp. JU1783]